MKHIHRIASLLLGGLIIVALNSCKEEDESLAVPHHCVSFLDDTIRVDEAAGTVEVALFLQSPGPVTVNYSVGGTAPANDFSITNSGTITIPEAGKYTSIKVDLNNNTVISGERTIELNLTGASNNVILGFNGEGKKCVIVINDEDKNAYFDTEATLNIPETPSQTNLIKIPVKVNSPSTSDDITVNYSITENNGIGAQDYQIVGVPGQVIIPKDSVQAFVSIQVFDDQLLENNESLKLTITGVVSPDAEAGVAADNTEIDLNVVDDTKLAEFNAPENQEYSEDKPSPIIIPVKLSEPALKTVTVNYTFGGTATLNADYTDNTGGALVFPIGVTTMFISISLTEDGLQEGNPNEIIEVNLQAPVSGDAEVVLGTANKVNITINDND